jgi:putative ABC transport system permease protein
MPTGYDKRNVLSLDFKFLAPPYYDADATLALTQELRTRLAALPGVTAITSAWAPGEQKRSTAAIAIEEFVGSERPAQEIVGYTYVQPNYFETVGVPLLQGRSFEGREQAVILSESAARQLWPTENAVGRSLRLGRTDEQLYFGLEPDADGPALQVVGVVRDKRNLDLGSDYQEIYLPLTEQQFSNRPILIRTQGGPEQVRGRLGTLLTSIDPTISATAETLEERLRHNSLFINSLLFGAFASAVGFCALLLALMGIYGTVGYIVVLRTREIGIRRSLGAQRRDLLALILGESTRPVLIGLAVGAPLAGGAVFLATRLLFGLSFVDMVATAAVTVLFLSVALIASYFPARRAMDIDPLTALRHDG